MHVGKDALPSLIILLPIKGKEKDGDAKSGDGS